MRKIIIIILTFTKVALSEELITPPQCKTDLSVPYIEELIKYGVNGTSIVDVYLNEKGIVDSAKILKSINSITDSLIRRKLFDSEFTPAIESGNSIPSVFSLEFPFFIKDAFKNKHSFNTFCITLVDSINGLFIDAAEVECRFKFLDTLEILKMSFDDYLNNLSKIPGQTRKEDRITAISTLDGKVSFYGISECEVDILIIHPDYKKVKIENVTIQKGRFKELKVNLLKKDGESIRKDLEVIVLEYRDDFNEYLNLDDVVEKVGLTDDLNEVVSKQPSIISMPKRNSLLIINSSGLFDTKYLINDIPVFSPTHFPGYANVNKGSLLLSDLTKVKLVTGRLGGRYSDVQGAVIDVSTVDIGIWKYDKKFNAFFDLSYEKFSLSFMLQDRPKNNRVQLTYSMGHKGLFKAYGNAGSFLKFGNDYGYSSPKNFYDLQLKSYNKIKKGAIETFIWLGIDQFNASGYLRERDVSIGFGSIVYRTSDEVDCLKFTVGGSFQYHDEGKRVGWISPLKILERKNLSFIIEKNEIEFLKLKLNQKFKFEGVAAEGTIGYRVPFQYFKLEDFKQEEMILTDKLGIQYDGEKGALGIDLLFGTKFSKESNFIDPGFWTLLPFFIGDVTFSIGIVSSYPDVRGFPSKSYSEKPYKTVNASTKLRLSFNEFVSTSIEPFMRFCDDYPKIGKDPIYNVWDESLDSPVYARGVNLGFDLELPKFFSMSLAGAFNKADRFINGEAKPYEWEVPWQVKGAFHLFFFKKLVNIYIKPTFFSGIPYYDYANNAKIEVSEPYSATDVILEFQVSEFNDAPLQKLKAFIGLENFSVNRDGSEVYWSEDMVPLSYNLTPLQLTFGARAAIQSRR